MLPAARRLAALAAGAIALAAAAVGQDDLRDLVVTTKGKQLRGRVATPFAADELVVQQGGKRIRVARADVASTATVADQLAAWLDRRARLQSQPAAQRFLVDEAAQKGMHGLARAQALWLALTQDDATAHARLDHKKGKDGWLWRHGKKLLPRPEWDAAIAADGLELVGERFVVRGGARPLDEVLALFDLERLGAHVMATFGRELGLREALQPVRVVVAASPGAFPKWGFAPVPYFVPAPHGDEARTFHCGQARPDRLFFVGAQGLLYRTLVGEVDRANDRDRVCPWLEIGLGMTLERSFAGDAGFAAPGPHRELAATAWRAQRRAFDLENLLHLPMHACFYLQDDAATAVHWSCAEAFVAWLLDPQAQPPRRAAFLRFAAQALGARKGDSSSAFDAAMGAPVESLDAPWRRWLEATARR